MNKSISPFNHAVHQIKEAAQLNKAPANQIYLQYPKVNSWYVLHT
jgi:hypothetical protein